jgi:hypothetical protein
MGVHWKSGGYSAHVEIFLVVDGEWLPVSHIGPYSFVLREPRRVRRGSAQIVIRIDGDEKHVDVILGSADPTEEEVTYA